MGVSFSTCAPPRPEIIKQIRRGQKLEKKWNESSDWKNIRDRYGKLEVQSNAHPIAGENINRSTEAKSFGYRMLDEIAMQTIKKPFDPYLPVSGAEYKRLNLRLDRLNRDLKSGKFTWFDSIFKVKKAVANKYPEVSYFLNSLSKIANFERGQNIDYISGVDKVSKNLTAALLEADKIKGIEKVGYKVARKVGRKDPHLAEIDNLWDQLLVARYEGDTKKLGEINRHLEEVTGRNSDSVIKKLINYVENNIKYDVVKGKNVPYSKHIIRAGDEMRVFFNSMGKVTTNGLRSALDVVAVSFFGKSTPDNVDLGTRLGKEFMNTKTQVNNMITSIENRMFQQTDKGIQQERDKARAEGREPDFRGYFPHYLITEYHKVRDLVNRAYPYNNPNAIKDEPGRLDLLLNEEYGLNTLIANFGDKGLLKRARSRYRDEVEGGDIERGAIEEGLDNAWQVNPIGVMKRYAEDTIAFNKIHHVKASFIRLYRNLNPQIAAEQPDFHKNLMGYMNEMYKTTTRGYIDRDPTLNGIVKAITSAEFASKLGLGVASAARNFVSANHYLAAVGYSSWAKSMNQYRTDKPLADTLNAIEQKQGFKFVSANLAAITEGLLPASGVDKSSIEYNEFKEEIKYRRNGKWEKIDKGMSKVAGNLAAFHAFGENVIRRNMFRTTFIMTYNTLKESPEFLRTRARGEQELYDIATNAALVAVNTYAYEYAAFGKAPIIGGTSRKFGAYGQVLGQFMHYPMSFLNQQYNMLREAGYHVKAGDFRSPEVIASVRYAGVYAFIHALSGAINLDLSHLFENDTAERIKDTITFLTATTDEEAEKAFHGSGLSTQVLGGPFVSDLIFAGNYMGLYRMPESDFGKIVFGYSDILEATDKEKKERLLSHINVEVSKWVYKNLPMFAAANPMGAVRHELGLYPRPWTKKAFYDWGLGKYIGERTSKVSKRELYSRGGSRRRPNVFKQSQEELASLYKAMGI